MDLAAVECKITGDLEDLPEYGSILQLLSLKQTVEHFGYLNFER